MPQTQATYGFGFSPISLENKDKAFADEMFAVKNAGILGILYGENKVPISANILNRSKRSLEKFKNEISSRNLTGDMYVLIPTDGILQVSPINNEEGYYHTSIFNANLTGANKKPVSYYAYLDFDVIHKQGYTIAMDENGYSMQVSYVPNGGGGSTFTYTGNYIGDGILYAQNEKTSGSVDYSVINISVSLGFKSNIYGNVDDYIVNAYNFYVFLEYNE